MSLSLELAITSGVIIAGFGTLFGHYVGTKKKVSEDHCQERRSYCNRILIERINHIDNKIDDLKDFIKTTLEIKNKE